MITFVVVLIVCIFGSLSVVRGQDASSTSRDTCIPQPGCRVLISPLIPASPPKGIATKGLGDTTPSMDVSRKSGNSSEAVLPETYPLPQR